MTVCKTIVILNASCSEIYTQHLVIYCYVANVSEPVFPCPPLPCDVERVLLSPIAVCCRTRVLLPHVAVCSGTRALLSPVAVCSGTRVLLSPVAVCCGTRILLSSVAVCCRTHVLLSPVGSVAVVDHVLCFCPWHATPARASCPLGLVTTLMYTPRETLLPLSLSSDSSCVQEAIDSCTAAAFERCANRKCHHVFCRGHVLTVLYIRHCNTCAAVSFLSACACCTTHPVGFEF